MEPQKHADTPWWTNLTAVLLTALVVGPATYYFATRPVSAPSGPAIPSFGTFFKDTVSYLPHILLLFGVLADMFTYQGVYSIPSLVALLTIPLNWLMKFFWAGIGDGVSKLAEVLRGDGGFAAARAATPATVKGRSTFIGQQGGGVGSFFRTYDGCDVQGFSWAHSPYAPQTLVITATVFSYYIFDLIMNRGWANAAAAITVFLFLYALQSLLLDNCDAPGSTADEPAMWLKSLAAFAEGLLFGGTSYAVVQSYYPGYLPTTAISPFPRKRAEDLTIGPNGTFTDSAGNPYICLANGQCYPDMSTTESRQAFAELAAESMGTGKPVTPENCPVAATK